MGVPISRGVAWEPVPDDPGRGPGACLCQPWSATILPSTPSADRPHPQAGALSCSVPHPTAMWTPGVSSRSSGEGVLMGMLGRCREARTKALGRGQSPGTFLKCSVGVDMPRGDSNVPIPLPTRHSRQPRDMLWACPVALSHLPEATARLAQLDRQVIPADPGPSHNPFPRLGTYPSAFQGPPSGLRHVDTGF